MQVKAEEKRKRLKEKELEWKGEKRKKKERKMAANLHMHIFERMTEEDLIIFSSNILGSKYFSWSFGNPPSEEKKDIAWKNIMNSPNIWVGEVSWLKAGLFEDSKTYIPDTIGEISNIIGEDLPIIDDEIIQKILRAFELENKTSYNVAKKDDVKNFLLDHKGKKIFTVSW